MDEILKCGNFNHRVDQYFPVNLLIMPYKVAPMFESVHEILKCYHSYNATEQYFPVFVVRYFSKRNL